MRRAQRRRDRRRREAVVDVGPRVARLLRRAPARGRPRPASGRGARAGPRRRTRPERCHAPGRTPSSRRRPGAMSRRAGRRRRRPRGGRGRRAAGGLRVRTTSANASGSCTTGRAVRRGRRRAPGPPRPALVDRARAFACGCAVRYVGPRSSREGEGAVGAAGRRRPSATRRVEGSLALDGVVPDRVERRLAPPARARRAATASSRPRTWRSVPAKRCTARGGPSYAGRPAASHAHGAATGQLPHAGERGRAHERAELHDRDRPRRRGRVVVGQHRLGAARARPRSPTAGGSAAPSSTRARTRRTLVSSTTARRP